jgi:hypothetical protein
MHRRIGPKALVGLTALMSATFMVGAPADAGIVGYTNVHAHSGTIQVDDMGGSPVGTFTLGAGGSGTPCSTSGTLDIDPFVSPPTYSASVTTVFETTMTGVGSPATHLATWTFTLNGTLTDTGSNPGPWAIADAGVNSATATFKARTGTCAAAGAVVCTLDATNLAYTGTLVNDTNPPTYNGLTTLGDAPNDGDIDTNADADHAVVSGSNGIFETVVAGTGCGALIAADNGQVAVTDLLLDDIQEDEGTRYSVHPHSGTIEARNPGGTAVGTFTIGGGTTCANTSIIDADSLNLLHTGLITTVFETTLSGAGSPATHLATLTVDLKGYMTDTGGNPGPWTSAIAGVNWATVTFKALTGSCAATGAVVCTLSSTALNLTGSFLNDNNPPTYNGLNDFGAPPNDGHITNPDADHLVFSGQNNNNQTSVTGTGCGTLAGGHLGRVVFTNFLLDDFDKQ